MWCGGRYRIDEIIILPLNKEVHSTENTVKCFKTDNQVELALQVPFQRIKMQENKSMRAHTQTLNQGPEGLITWVELIWFRSNKSGPGHRPEPTSKQLMCPCASKLQLRHCGSSKSLVKYMLSHCYSLCCVHNGRILLTACLGLGM